jgi:hypothetical protein
MTDDDVRDKDAPAATHMAPPPPTPIRAVPLILRRAACRPGGLRPGRLVCSMGDATPTATGCMHAPTVQRHQLPVASATPGACAWWPCSRGVERVQSALPSPKATDAGRRRPFARSHPHRGTGPVRRIGEPTAERARVFLTSRRRPVPPRADPVGCTFTLGTCAFTLCGWNWNWVADGRSWTHRLTT